MKALMLKSVGSVYGWAYNAGTEIESGPTWSKTTVPQEVLDGWVRSGVAAPATGSPIDVATIREPETAAVAAPRGRRTKGR